MVIPIAYPVSQESGLLSDCSPFDRLADILLHKPVGKLKKLAALLLDQMS